MSAEIIGTWTVLPRAAPREIRDDEPSVITRRTGWVTVDEDEAISWTDGALMVALRWNASRALTRDDLARWADDGGRAS